MPRNEAQPKMTKPTGQGMPMALRPTTSRVGCTGGGFSIPCPVPFSVLLQTCPFGYAVQRARSTWTMFSAGFPQSIPPSETPVKRPAQTGTTPPAFAVEGIA